MRAYTIICVFRSKHHEHTIRIGRLSVHGRGLIGREVNRKCLAQVSLDQHTAHRRSGLIGFLAGAVYGIVRLIVAPLVARHFGIAILPSIMMNREAAYVFSVIVTAGTMILVSLLYGWEPRGKLLHEEKSGWLRASQSKVRELGHPSLSVTHGRWSHLLPPVLALIVVAIGCVLSFVVFW